MSVHPDPDDERFPSAVIGGSEGVEVLILTRDRSLASEIRSALAGAHRVHHARRPEKAIELLAECNAGVLITDGAERSSFHKRSRRLRDRFPDLVIVGVGDRDAAETLIEAMNGGRIDSVMLKPLSPGRVRQQVRNAVHRHLMSRFDGDEAADASADWDGDRTMPHSARWLEDPAGLPAPRSRRRWLIGGIAAAVAAGTAWAFVPGGLEDFRRLAPVMQSAFEVVFSPELERTDAAAGVPVDTAAGSDSTADVSIEPTGALPESSDASRDRAAMRERLALASARIASNNLTRPEHDSAMFHLLALRAEFPGEEAIVAGLQRLADTLLELTDAAIAERKFASATRWLGAVDDLGVRPEALDARRAALANAEAAAAEAVANAAAALTQAALEEELARTEAALAAAVPEQRSTVSEDADDALAAGDPPVRIASTTPVAIGPEIHAGSGEISELKIVRLVEPEYPRLAYVRDIDGWIDVEFTVTEAGRTRGVEITGAQVPGWFDRAAIDAVGQWRFEPELRDGEPVERRAKVRLQFRRDE